MTRAENNEWSSSFLLRLAGYGLLILVLFDLIDIFFPPHFMDPIWEFQTLGALVERVPIPLLGFVLIFYKEGDIRAKWEPVILKILSWVSLLVGVLFLLLIVLGVSNTLRINNLNNSQIATQAAQQMSQIQRFEEQLDKATDNDLESLFARANAQGKTPNIKNPQELKNRILTEVDKTEKSLKTQAEAARKDKNLALTKSSFKWNLGALIAGVWFIRIWHATRWARESPKRKSGW